jgi:hypothetical protein
MLHLRHRLSKKLLPGYYPDLTKQFEENLELVSECIFSGNYPERETGGISLVTINYPHFLLI